MKREHQIQQIKANIEDFKKEAEKIKNDIQSGAAEAYEKRVGHDPGYMKDLADSYLETADKLQERLRQYEKR